MRKNNNNQFTFSLSSNNKHFKFNSFKTLTFQSQKIINFFSMINYKNEANQKENYNENLKMLIFLLCQNRLIQFQRIKNPKTYKEELEDSKNNCNLNTDDFLKYKFFLNSKNNDICYILLTKKKIFLGKYDNKKKEDYNNIRLIFDISQIDKIQVKDFFIPNISGNNNMYILLSNNMIIQIDYTKNCINNNELILSILKFQNEDKYFKKKYKEENDKNKNFIIIDFECKENGKISFTYSLYKFQNQTINILTCLIFSNKKEEEKINFISVYKNKYLILALNKGKVRLISLYNFKILSQFKSNFGTINSISFSYDGNLLGIGAQDNNAYIIDLNNQNIISCLEGHNNYISKIIFELHESIGNYSNLINFTSDINRINSINRNKKNIFIQVEKDIIIKHWINSHNKNLDEKRNNIYRKNTTIKLNNQNQYKIYDIYTSGLDGKIGSYRIEYYENNNNNDNNHLNVNNTNLNNINNNNLSNNNDDDDDGSVPTSRDNEEYNKNKNIIQKFSKKICELKNIIYLIPPKGSDEYEKDHFVFMNSFNIPIIDFLKIDLFSVIVQKLNVFENEIKIIFFCGECENEKNENKDNMSNFKNKNITNDNSRNIYSDITSNSFIVNQMKELNKSCVIIKPPK